MFYKMISEILVQVEFYIISLIFSNKSIFFSIFNRIIKIIYILFVYSFLIKNIFNFERVIIDFVVIVLPSNFYISLRK